MGLSCVQLHELMINYHQTHTSRSITENEEFLIEYRHEYWRDGGYPRDIMHQACKAYNKTKDKKWKQILQALDKELTKIASTRTDSVRQLDKKLCIRFDIIDIEPDGNCMFNAIAHQMSSKQTKWAPITGTQLRHTV